jgi:cytosine/uracil/thiamine/allantoin permease
MTADDLVPIVVLLALVVGVLVLDYFLVRRHRGK